MWSVVFSSPAVYLLLAWITLLAALFAIAKPDRSPAAPFDVDQRFSWKWLQPAPPELRPLMRMAAARRGFHQDVLASYAVAANARFSEEIKRIRRPV
jgi:hypothetical protein